MRRLELELELELVPSELELELVNWPVSSPTAMPLRGPEAIVEAVSAASTVSNV